MSYSTTILNEVLISTRYTKSTSLNKMACSELQNSTSMSNSLAPESQSPEHSIIPDVRKKRVLQTDKPVPYVRGLSARERVDMVLYELFEKHRWSIKDFIYHLVTAKPEKKNGVRSSVRAKTLSDAIYKQKEVVEQLSNVSNDIYTMGDTDLTSHL